MKKSIFCLLFGISLTVNTQAQENNLFQDVDADGWLWFDTQEKIDKYIGNCNDDENKIAPNGKPIQMVRANQAPDYPADKVFYNFPGAGHDGELGSDGAITGSIILPPATGLSAFSNGNGGGIAVMMPSCSSFALSLSCEGKGYVRLCGSKDINKAFTDYTVISAKYSAWSPLFPDEKAGITHVHDWTGLETLDNNNEDESLRLRLKSDTPIYAYFNSASTSTMYIHGIRVTTPTQTSIRETTQESSRIFLEGNRVVLHEAAPIKVFNMCGTAVISKFTDRLDLKGLPTGIYIVKAGERTRKIFVQ